MSKSHTISSLAGIRKQLGWGPKYPLLATANVSLVWRNTHTALVLRVFFAYSFLGTAPKNVPKLSVV